MAAYLDSKSGQCNFCLSLLDNKTRNYAKLSWKTLCKSRKSVADMMRERDVNISDEEETLNICRQCQINVGKIFTTEDELKLLKRNQLASTSLATVMGRKLVGVLARSQELAEEDVSSAQFSPGVSKTTPRIRGLKRGLTTPASRSGVKKRVEVPSTEKSKMTAGKPKRKTALQISTGYFKQGKYSKAFRLMSKNSKVFNRELLRFYHQSIKAEVVNICSTRANSMWRGAKQGESKMAKYRTFSWQKLLRETKSHCPILYGSVLASFAKFRQDDSTILNAQTRPLIGTIFAIVLFARCKRMKIIQELVGLELWLSRCNREVFRRLNGLGVCPSIHSITLCIDTLTKEFNKDILQKKKELTLKDEHTRDAERRLQSSNGAHNDGEGEEEAEWADEDGRELASSLELSTREAERAVVPPSSLPEPMLAEEQLATHHERSDDSMESVRSPNDIPTPTIVSAKNTPEQAGQSEKNVKKRDAASINKPSVRKMLLRESHGQYEEDHKNVKATPEFRTFVAKKLAGVLDGRLKMTMSKKEGTSQDGGSKDCEEDALRLVSTSSCAPNLDSSEPPAPVKRKRPRLGRNAKKLSQINNENDSSDLDADDQRLAEAAISGHQILNSSALPATSPHTTEEITAVADVSSKSKVITNNAESASDTESKVEGQTKDSSADDNPKRKKIRKMKDPERTKNGGINSVSDCKTNDRSVTEGNTSAESVRKKKKKNIRKMDDSTKSDVPSYSEADIPQRGQYEDNRTKTETKRRKKKKKRNGDKDADENDGDKE